LNSIDPVATIRVDGCLRLPDPLRTRRFPNEAGRRVGLARLAGRRSARLVMPIAGRPAVRVSLFHSRSPSTPVRRRCRMRLRTETPKTPATPSLFAGR